MVSGYRTGGLQYVTGIPVYVISGTFFFSNTCTARIVYVAWLDMDADEFGLATFGLWWLPFLPRVVTMVAKAACIIACVTRLTFNSMLRTSSFLLCETLPRLL